MNCGCDECHRLQDAVARALYASATVVVDPRSLQGLAVTVALQRLDLTQFVEGPTVGAHAPDEPLGRVRVWADDATIYVYMTDRTNVASDPNQPAGSTPTPTSTAKGLTMIPIYIGTHEDFVIRASIGTNFYYRVAVGTASARIARVSPPAGKVYRT